MMLWQRYRNRYCCVNSTSWCFQDAENFFPYSTWDVNVRFSQWSFFSWSELVVVTTRVLLLKGQFFPFFFCALPNRDYLSGDLETWIVDLTDAVGEGCLGRSVPGQRAGLVMSSLKVWFKAPVVNRSHSVGVSRHCVRPLEPDEPSALTNLPY